MGLATTGGAEVEGYVEAGTKMQEGCRNRGGLVGLRLRLKAKAGWLAFI